MQTAVSAPFLNTWCHSSFLTFYLNYLPLWSVSDDQKLEKKKKNKTKRTFLFETRFELRYDHPFTTGRIATKVIVISVSVFFFLSCFRMNVLRSAETPEMTQFSLPSLEKFLR